VENINAIENNDPSLVGLPINIAETQPSPDNPPWGSWTAFGVWIASIVFLVVFGNVFVIIYVLAVGFPIADNEALTTFVKTDAGAVIVQFLATIPAHLLTLVMAWYVVTKARKYSFREMLGWKWGGFRYYHAILLTLGFYALTILVVSALGDVENDFDVMLKSSRVAVYLVAFLAVFTAPIVEEVVYRGILYSAFQRSMGKAAAVIIVTILFAAVHVLQYSQELNPDYAVLIVLVLLSLVITLVRVRTDNLLPCIVLHTVFNGFQSLIMIAEPFLRPYLENNESTVGTFLK
jgi:membrane protease YdiL (CAAX protease family)